MEAALRVVLQKEGLVSLKDGGVVVLGVYKCGDVSVS